jgi:hypothetical protein
MKASFGAAAGALALLTGLSAAAPAGAQSVKIGFIATFSGPAGSLGRDLYDGFMLGVEHSGGKLGGLTPEMSDSRRRRSCCRRIASTSSPASSSRT